MFCFKSLCSALVLLFQILRVAIESTFREKLSFSGCAHAIFHPWHHGVFAVGLLQSKEGRQTQNILFCLCVHVSATPLDRGIQKRTTRQDAKHSINSINSYRRQLWHAHQSEERGTYGTDIIREIVRQLLGENSTRGIKHRRVLHQSSEGASGGIVESWGRSR